MRQNAARLVRVGVSFLGISTLGLILTLHAAGPAQQGFPTDWSHRHLIFSQPTTAEQVGAVANDLRYWQQWYRQNVARPLPREVVEYGEANLDSDRRFIAGSRGDWQQDLGSGANAGADVFPAKYSFSTNAASCTDFVVFPTGLAGVSGPSGQATIIAYDNLYSGGCTSGTVPSVYWAYNTGAAQVLTSPAISIDGTQVAFVQSYAVGGPAALVLLKWAASTTETVSNPQTLTPVSNALYRACTAPCMTQIFLVDSHNNQIDDRTSSVFPDYYNDVMYVGGALGWLHKINGAFHGTPGEVTTNGFPVQVNTTTYITSPVRDQVTGNVFVGDASGFLYSVTNNNPPVVTQSKQVDFGVGLVSGPIVDSTAGKVYVFSSGDGSTSCGGSPCSAVFKFGTSFTQGQAGSEAIVGTSSATPNPLYAGGFDSTYLASSNATGNLYVCGNTGGSPTLYQVPILNGNMGTVLTGPTLTSATAACSPVSDIANANATPNPNEWIFAGVKGSGSGNNCASAGCVMQFVDKQWAASTAYVVGQEVLDTHFQIQVVRVAGTSKSTNPVWSTTVGATTSDNTIRWLNQGPLVASYATWQASHPYTAGQEIVDSNGNIQLVIVTGNSKAGTHPTWSKVINGVTNEGVGLVRWRNVGAMATASIAAAGGSGGIILDNTVGTGTMKGASQVYFFTQGNQTTCGTSSNVGCAVQASQSALQ